MKGNSSTWARTRDMVINSHPLYRLSYRGIGDSGWTRTSDRLLRRQLLYPTELLSHETIIPLNDLIVNGELEIRTLEEVTPLQHFQCCSFNHSDNSPIGLLGFEPRSHRYKQWALTIRRQSHTNTFS